MKIQCMNIKVKLLYIIDSCNLFLRNRELTWYNLLCNIVALALGQEMGLPLCVVRQTNNTGCGGPAKKEGKCRHHVGWGMGEIRPYHWGLICPRVGVLELVRRIETLRVYRVFLFTFICLS